MNGENELPQEWKDVSLGDICQFQYGKSLVKGQRNSEGEYNVYGSNGIVGKHSKFLVDDPCLIVGRKGAAGEIHFSSTPCWPIDTTYFITENNNFKLKYLYYQLKALQLSSLEKSTAVPGLNRNDAYNKKIYLPSIEEQRLIVEKIEELFSELDKGIENLKTAQQQLKVYRQAVLKWAFEGKLTNDDVQDGELPQGWELQNLKNIGKLYCGQSPSIQEVNREGRGILYVTGPEQWTGRHIEANKWTEYPKRIVPEGTIFITVKGAGVGKLFPGTACAIGRDIYAYLPNETIDFKFAYYALKFNIDQVKIKAQGDIPGLAKNHILDHFIGICKLDEQHRLVQEIESRLSVCDKIEETITSSLQQAEALMQSILKRAFEGRLVKMQKAQQEATVVSIAAKRDDWQRKVLAGKIIYACHKDRSFGITKFQKTLYLCEQHAQLNFDTHYLKQTAGPLDQKFIYPFIKEAENDEWFIEDKTTTPHRFEPLPGIGNLTQHYVEYFKPVADKINFVIKLLQGKTTDEAELIATIYAIWNNYLIEGKDLNDDSLIAEVYDWSESKAKFRRNNIITKWQWMKNNGLIPVGFGVVIERF